MDCPSCGHPIPSEARFCGGCGASTVAVIDCPGCGTSNPSGQRFCNSCGHELSPITDGAGVTPEAGRPERRSRLPEHLASRIRAGRGVAVGERKNVTVLFADVMGSMDLAEQQDPEAWRQIMGRFFEILCDGVHRFEGTVDKFTGDGIMALFGAPIAHEDHAQRACYSALHLEQELAAYAAQLRREQGLSFSVRIGLNSGEVVVGEIGEDLEMSYTAVGHTVGLAQRMEQLAEPGSASGHRDRRRGRRGQEPTVRHVRPPLPRAWRPDLPDDGSRARQVDPAVARVAHHALLFRRDRSGLGSDRA